MTMNFAAKTFAAVVAAALVVSAPAQAQTKDVKVAVIPTLDAGPLLLAKEKGFFQKRGLNVDINAGGVGATIIPTVLSGEFNIGYANVISDLQAIDRGLPLLLIFPTYAHPTDPAKDPYRVYVDPNGPIKDAKQLASANIGTPSLKNLPDWTTLKSLENLGVKDFSKLRWTRVSGEEAYSAVKSGQIDATWLPQPAGAAAIKAGLVPILAVNTGSIPKAVGGYFITSRVYADANPDVIAKFNEALAEANAYAMANPNEGRDVIIQTLKFNKDLVYAADLNDYPQDPNLASLKVIASDLVRYGLIRKEPDFENVLWKKK